MTKKYWFYTISPNGERHQWSSWDKAVEEAEKRGGVAEEEMIEVTSGNREYRYRDLDGKVSKVQAERR